MTMRGDIDGLRAIAILPVLVFHLDPALCPAGFIGVDVFFVISGYLITKQILAEGPAFSFATFYVRRAFRLLPALLVTLLATVAAGWWILSPTDYDALARSAIAAGLGLANLYFFVTIDYFNAGSHLHPLLHTWSLGVEEQFYLLWPAALWVCHRHVGLLVTAMITTSLMAVAVVQPRNPELVFYAVPFRMFEFGIGAAVLWAGRFAGPAWVANAAGGTGAILVAACFSLLDEATPWPGAWTLLTALGTALLIMAGRRGVWHAILSNTLLSAIGRISYSLYLVHWPLFTLYRMRAVIEPSRLELLMLGIASIALAAILHVTIEKPFRLPAGVVRPMRLRTMYVTIIGAILLSCTAAVAALHGVPSRLDRSRVQFFDQGLTFAGDLCDFRSSRCVFGDRRSSRVVYVIGDSHALNLIWGLDALFRETGVKGIAFYDHGCLFLYRTQRFSSGVPDRRCLDNVEAAYSHLLGNRDPVILAADYAGYRNSVANAGAEVLVRHNEHEYATWLADRLEASLAMLGNRVVVVFKQGYSTGIDIPKCLSRPGVNPSACAAWSRERVLTEYAAYDRVIDAAVSKFASVTTLDPKAVFCATDACVIDDHRGLYLRDASHLTNVGSAFLIDRIRTNLLKIIFAVR